MSTSQASMKQNSDTTPPSSFAKHPLTPPPTDEKRFSQARRVLALFEAIQHGKHFSEGSWRKFQLVEGEYEEIERRLKKNHELFGYTKDKIRYDYNGESNRLVVRMPTAVHELFIARVEDAIFSQLKLIREGLGDAAAFARKVQPARSTEIYFPTETIASTKQSKYEPDASFWHDDAQYPGVIIEVAYSQKRQRLNRLAENYLLDSDTSVRVVVGLDIEYGMRESRKATLSVWRSRIHHTADGDELRVVQEVCDEAFRDDQGNPSHHPGLRLRLSDFACEELSKEITGSEDQEITISTQQLCHYLAAAEDKIRRQGTLVRHSIPLSVKKRKRSETPPENIASDDEVKLIDLEERAAKRIADNDPDYEDT